jgi:hypothetical protein
MPIAPEVNPFQREVGGDQRFVTRRYLQDRAVISDTDPCRSDILVRRSSRVGSSHPANLGDQRFFSKRHGTTNI